MKLVLIFLILLAHALVDGSATTDCKVDETGVCKAKRSPPPVVTISNDKEEVLHKKAKLISISDIQEHKQDLQDNIEDLHAALEDFRIKNGYGRAIAAPQIGLSIQMIALNLNGNKRTLFNPVITYKSAEKFSMWDDCLSFPDYLVSLQRHKQISVEFINENGEEEAWNHLDQATSELLQHEIDHLNGVVALNLGRILVDSNGVPIVGFAYVRREEWLRNKAYYQSLVDYSIS